MIDLKDQAKKLLMKGKELKDPDIIQMALEMLESYEAPKEPAPVKKKVVKQAKPVAKKITGASNRRIRNESTKTKHCIPQNSS